MSTLTIDAVRTLIQKPFAPRGRGPAAFDCWGLVIWVRALGGKATPDYAVHHADAAGVAACAGAAKDAGAFSPVERPKVFDVVEFKPVDGFLHFGVMIDRKTFLDVTDDGAGVKPNRIDNPWMEDRIAAFWRKD